MNDSDPQAARLSAELERATLRALAQTYDSLNFEYFKGSLRRPTIAFADATSRLGSFVSVPRGIELSPKLLHLGWGVAVEVLKHEMAHQFVIEVLGDPDGAAHGPTFRRVCEERGFDSAATGLPTAQADADTPESKTLERIAKLLALAESPNEHEAQAAMSAARRLMLKYNLEEIAAPNRSTQGFRHLGEPTGRVSESERILAVILSEYFFVETIWVPVWRPLEGKRGSVLEAIGSRANLEMAHYVYDFLSHTAEQLWRLHKERQGIRGNRDRRAFVAGVMNGFRQKLESERKQATQQGLVWVGDPELSKFFKRRHPRVRWTRHSGSSHNPAHRAGKEQGQRIVLHRGISRGPKGGGPKLLKS
ncbi:MAG: DUF2786 domain-containing protein [Polyangiaceae bacterium]|nr:DUF2786 domain-containing protein [Polyangiaceae bacterium]MCB9605802.1 DUF2786 domain-containing protein [Polyangiaceae bacterium]